MAPQEPLRRWPEQQMFVARRRTRMWEAFIVGIALIAVIAFALGHRGPVGAQDGNRRQPAAVGQPNR